MEPSIPGGICSVECLQTLPFVDSRIVPVEEEYYRNQIDERTNKYYNVADSERLARLDAKEVDVACAFAFKQKERARLVVIAVQQILNSISARVNQLTK